VLFRFLPRQKRDLDGYRHLGQQHDLLSGPDLPPLRFRLHHDLNVGAEILSSPDFLDRLQRLALGPDASNLRPISRKALLRFDPLAPSAHYPVSSPSQSVRGISRGALMFSGNFDSTEEWPILYQTLRY